MSAFSQASPRRMARITGVFYLVTFVAGVSAMRLRGGPSIAANLIGDGAYVVVVLLLYAVFRPVSRGLSLLAAIAGLAGCAWGLLSQLDLAPLNVSPLVFFGVYCLLIGALVLGSAFMPRFLGVGMAIAGLGWLTYLSPSLAGALSPYNMAPGMIGEAAFTLWLLVAGVNAQRWSEQARAATGRNGRADGPVLAERRSVPGPERA